MISPIAENARLDFLNMLDRLPPDRQRAAIRAEIGNTGSSMEPQDRQAYAIYLFGIQAVGISMADAVRQWRGMARTMAGGWETAAKDGALHAAQLEWATWVLQRHACNRCVNRQHLTAACRLVLQLSTNPTLRIAATELARAQNLFPRPERAAEA